MKPDCTVMSASPWRASPHTIAIQSAIDTVNLVVQRMANRADGFRVQRQRIRNAP